MAYTRTNLIVGAAKLWVLPADSGFEAADVTLAAGDDTFAEVQAKVATAIGLALVPTTGTAADAEPYDVGFTQEGIEVSYEPDYGEIEVDQFMGPARLFKQGQNLTVNTTLAEATLENLLTVWGQTDATLTGGTLDIVSGELGEAPVERQLVFLGPGPASGTGAARLYVVNYALQTETSAHALRKNEATVFPVSFRAMPGDDGKYGQVRDLAYVP